jgi:predicted GIY-YIG superfamily endonuclease
VWYVHFLELSNGDVYVGSTNDFRRRFNSHQDGQVVSTSKLLPAVLRSYVAVTDEAAVRSLERYFKSGSGKAFAKKRFLTMGGRGARNTIGLNEGWAVGLVCVAVVAQFPLRDCVSARSNID